MTLQGLQLNPPRTTSLARRLIALACLIALTAVACGSGTTQVSAERAVEQAPGPQPSGHAYGTSINDWKPAAGESETASSAVGADQGANAEATDAASIVWEDLVPPGFSGPEIVARYQERLDAIEPGSAEASALFAEMQAEFDPEAVNPQLDGQQIRLAGFVAPLTYQDDIVTEFLLVPTYGACIHVPPPPPNQTIMVSVDKSNGLTTDEAWGAVWVEGTISVSPATTELASASYTISNATSGVYSDF